MPQGVLYMGVQNLSAGDCEVASVRRGWDCPVLAPAGHSQLQGPHCWAGLGPAATLVVPLGNVFMKGQKLLCSICDREVRKKMCEKQPYRHQGK